MEPPGSAAIWVCQMLPRSICVRWQLRLDTSFLACPQSRMSNSLTMQACTWTRGHRSPTCRSSAVAHPRRLLARPSTVRCSALVEEKTKDAGQGKDGASGEEDAAAVLASAPATGLAAVPRPPKLPVAETICMEGV